MYPYLKPEEVKKKREVFESRFTPWKPQTMGAFFDDRVAEFADNELIFTLERSYTYKETQEIVDNLAKGLIKLGIKRREHIIGNIANWPEVLFLRFACAKIGAVFVSVNVRYRAIELEYVIKHSDACCIFTMDNMLDLDYIETLNELIPELRNTKSGELLKSDKFPLLRHVVVASKHSKKFSGTLDFYDVVNMGKDVADEELAERHAASQYPDEVYDLCYTSGTTGEPKGCLIRHESYLYNGYGHQYTRCCPDKRRSFVTLPLNHTFAITESLIPTMYVGGCVCLLEVFRLPEAYEVIEKGKAWDFPCVPTMMVAFLDHPDRKKYDLSSLKAVHIAAAPAPLPLWERTLKELQVDDLFTGYGQTETAGGDVSTPPDMPVDLFPRYCGETRMGGNAGVPEYGGKVVQYKVVDPVTGEDLPEGSEGELACRGPVVIRKFYKNPEENEKTFDKDGWMRTGDFAIMRKEKMLWGDVRTMIELTGRSKEIYIRGGENISPVEIEYILSKHPKVKQAVVVGVPDLKLGEVGAAYIEIGGGETCTKQEIIDYAKKNMASFKVPKYVEFVDKSEIPLTTSGKIQKFKLKERAINDYGLQEAARQLESIRHTGR